MVHVNHAYIFRQDHVSENMGAHRQIRMKMIMTRTISTQQLHYNYGVSISIMANN